jgi:hypothetical protein
MLSNHIAYKTGYFNYIINKCYHDDEDNHLVVKENLQSQLDRRMYR